MNCRTLLIWDFKVKLNTPLSLFYFLFDLQLFSSFNHNSLIQCNMLEKLPIYTRPAWELQPKTLSSWEEACGQCEVPNLQIGIFTLSIKLLQKICTESQNVFLHRKTRGKWNEISLTNLYEFRDASQRLNLRSLASEIMCKEYLLR